MNGFKEVTFGVVSVIVIIILFCVLIKVEPTGMDFNPRLDKCLDLGYQIGDDTCSVWSDKYSETISIIDVPGFTHGK